MANTRTISADQESAYLDPLIRTVDVLYRALQKTRLGIGA